MLLGINRIVLLSIFTVALLGCGSGSDSNSNNLTEIVEIPESTDSLESKSEPEIAEETDASDNSESTTNTETTDETNTSSSTNSKKLQPPENSEIYFGAFAEFSGVEDEVTTAKINKFDDLAGKPVAFSYFSNNWYEYTNYGIESTIKYPKDNIHTAHNLGKTPFIRLLPWSRPRQIGDLSSTTRLSSGADLVPICHHSDEGGNYNHLVSKSEVSSHQSHGDTIGNCSGAFSMRKIAEGEWDDELRQWAKDSKTDRDSNGDIIPLLVTFTIEMNGYWFPWSGIYNGGAIKTEYGNPNLADGPESYRDAYRHVIDLFREEQVEHITWFFIPDTLDPNEDWVSFLTEPWNHQKNYYPGDDYIDWIGTNLYGAASKNYQWSNFSDDLAIKSAAIKEITSSKPIALMEFGVIDGHSGGTKSEWMEDTFKTITNGDYIEFKAISYWHDHLGSGTPAMKIDSSPESLATFKGLVSNPRFISKMKFQ